MASSSTHLPSATSSDVVQSGTVNNSSADVSSLAQCFFKRERSVQPWLWDKYPHVLPHFIERLSAYENDFLAKKHELGADAKGEDIGRIAERFADHLISCSTLYLKENKRKIFPEFVRPDRSLVPSLPSLPQSSLLPPGPGVPAPVQPPAPVPFYKEGMEWLNTFLRYYEHTAKKNWPAELMGTVLANKTISLASEFWPVALENYKKKWAQFTSQIPNYYERGSYGKHFYALFKTAIKQLPRSTADDLNVRLYSLLDKEGQAQLLLDLFASLKPSDFYPNPDELKEVKGCMDLRHDRHSGREAFSREKESSFDDTFNKPDDPHNRTIEQMDQLLVRLMKDVPFLGKRRGCSVAQDNSIYRLLWENIHNAPAENFADHLMAIGCRQAAEMLQNNLAKELTTSSSSTASIMLATSLPTSSVGGQAVEQSVPIAEGNLASSSTTISNSSSSTNVTPDPQMSSLGMRPA